MLEEHPELAPPSTILTAGAARRFRGNGRHRAAISLTATTSCPR